MTGIDALYPEPIPVAYGGTMVNVFPLRIDQLVRFSRAIRPAVPALMSGQLQIAIEEHFDAVRQAVSIGTGIPEAELSEVWPDEFVDLLAAVMRANLDFFVKRLAPAVQRLVPVVVAMRAGPTGTSSSQPSSPAGDTTAAPSES